MKLPFVSQDTDMYVVVVVNLNGVETSEPMTEEQVSRYITKKFGEQPLNYFNDNGRIKVIHLRTGLVRMARVRLELRHE